MALVARNTWMRGRAASFKARHAVSMSSRVQRARPAMIGPCTSRATRFTDSQSPREAIGKPASMMSTPKLGERLRDPQLFWLRHAAAGRLFAVPQCGIEDEDPIGVGHRYLDDGATQPKFA